MKEQILAVWNREKKRLIPLVVILGLMYLHDPDGFGVVLYMLGLMTTIALAIGPLRRLMFPHLDMGVVTDKAEENPISAGLVVIGICMVISSIIVAVGGLLH